MNLSLQNAGKVLGAFAVAGAMMAYIGTNLTNALQLKSVYAEETAQKSCFVRTTSNCPKIGGQDGGQRVTCDTSGTSVPNSTCTPVECVFGAKPPIDCPTPPPTNTGTGSGTETGTGTGTGTGH